MVEYKCPYCGRSVNIFILTSYPPITKYKCVCCSYEYETRGEMTQPVIAPIQKQGEYYEKSTTGC